MENLHSKEIALMRTTVKIPGGRPRGSEAPRTSISQPSVSNGQANQGNHQILIEINEIVMSGFICVEKKGKGKEAIRIISSAFHVIISVS